MADSLGLKGKIAGMQGIIDATDRAEIQTNVGVLISFIADLTESDFTVSAVTGAATNNAAMVFPIATVDVGEIAQQIQLLDSNGAMLVSADLDATVTFDYVGEATIAAGELSITL